jgi:peptidoglycan LD-endopeptidase LytH
VQHLTKVNLKQPHWNRYLPRNLTKFVLILLLGLGFTLFLAKTETGGRMRKAMMLFVHVARMQGKAPDTALSLPVKDVRKEQIPNSWQAPRGESRLHEGQDIFAPRGTPILSATDGYVVRIGEQTLGGQTVWVIGNGGRRYYYAHLDAYAPNLEVGDYVTRQTVLGYVGTTGNAEGTRPHLHFGVYTNTGAIDPLPLMIDRPEEKKAEPKSEKPKPKPKRQQRIRAVARQPGEGLGLHAESVKQNSPG